MKSPRPFQFAIRAQADGAYHISVRGIIGEYVDYGRWTVSDTEEDVLNELKQIPEGKQIHVHVNSRGGDVGLGLGIYNALSRRKKDVTTYNDGYAMSAAAIVMLAGHKRVTPAGSIGMIHRSQGGVDGTGEDMRTMADGMDVIDESMAKVLAQISGKHSAEEFLKMMDKTTFFDGEKAVEMGLATHCEGEIENDDEGDITDSERRVIALFEKKVPENLRARVCGRLKRSGAPAPRAQGGPSPANNNQPKKQSMKLIIAALIAAGYSVAGDAEEAAVLPHVNALVSDRAKFKAENEKHETALKNRVTSKVEKAITDKLIKAERKEALIKAGMADESTLDFIDDIRAEQNTHRPRGVVPARREAGEGADDVATQITDLAPRIRDAETAEERGELVAQSIKLRGLDQLFAKRTAVKGN